MFKRSIDETMNDILMFSIVHNNIFSINNMSDEELRQSIVDDILMVTMMEKEEKTSINFGQHELFRWIKPLQHARVYNQLTHPEISGLIEHKNGQIRIKDVREVLQAAMDYCGHWWDGFNIPNEPGIITMNHEKVSEMIQDAGGFDQFIDNLAQVVQADMMDNSVTVPVSKSLN